MNNILKYLGYFIGFTCWIPALFLLFYIGAFHGGVWYFFPLIITNFILIFVAAVTAVFTGKYLIEGELL